MNLEKELLMAKTAATKAGNYLKGVYAANIVSSIGKDIKLDSDMEANRIILDILSHTCYPIISEEKENNPSTNCSEPTWIWDPLDGSFNFYRNIPYCAVSGALWQKNSPLLGVIYDFNRDDLYHGTEEKGSFLNGQKISVSKTKDKKEAVIFTGFPSNYTYIKDNLSDLSEKINDYKKIRLIGSAVLSLSHVASGRGDAYHEKGIRFWDVAGGLALVKFAGGQFDVQDLGNDKYNVFASNGRIK